LTALQAAAVVSVHFDGVLLSGAEVANLDSGLPTRETSVYEATGAPSATNDSVDTSGIGRSFKPGDLWRDSTSVRTYLCQSSAASAAVWLGLSTSTSGLLHLYLSETGDDTADGRTATTARKTFEGIGSLVPDRLLHATILHVDGTIELPAGGYTFRNIEIGDSAVFLIAGSQTYAIWDDNTGSNYTATASDIRTVTVAAAGWTVNEWRGRIVEPLAGTYVGRYFMVTSNTSDTLEILGKQDIGTVDFRFMTPSSVINAGTTGDTLGFKNIYGSFGAALRLQDLRMSGTTEIQGYGIRAEFSTTSVISECPVAATHNDSLELRECGPVFLGGMLDRKSIVDGSFESLAPLGFPLGSFSAVNTSIKIINCNGGASLYAVTAPELWIVTMEATVGFQSNFDTVYCRDLNSHEISDPSKVGSFLGVGWSGNPNPMRVNGLTELVNCRGYIVHGGGTYSGVEFNGGLVIEGGALDIEAGNVIANTGGKGLTVNRGANVACSADISGSTGSVLVEEGSFLDIADGTIDNGVELYQSAGIFRAAATIDHDAGTCISLQASTARLDAAVSGTADTTYYGVRLASGSTVMLRSGGTPTIAGSGGDFTFDGSSSAGTWAGVVAGTPVVENATDTLVVKNEW